MVRFRPMFGRRRQTLAMPAEVGPNRAEFGPNSDDFDRLRPDSGQSWPGFGQQVTIWAEVGPNLAGFVKSWATSARYRPNLARIRPHFDDSARFGSKSAQVQTRKFCSKTQQFSDASDVRADLSNMCRAFSRPGNLHARSVVARDSPGPQMCSGATRLICFPINLGRFSVYGRALRARREMAGLIKDSGESSLCRGGVAQSRSKVRS